MVALTLAYCAEAMLRPSCSLEDATDEMDSSGPAIEEVS